MNKVDLASLWQRNLDGRAAEREQRNAVADTASSAGEVTVVTKGALSSTAADATCDEEALGQVQQVVKSVEKDEKGKEKGKEKDEEKEKGGGEKDMGKLHLSHINVTTAERTDIGLPIAEVAKSWGPRSTSTKHRPKKQFQSASSEE